MDETWKLVPSPRGLNQINDFFLFCSNKKEEQFSSGEEIKL